jgi:hypothetical protein
VDRRINGGSFNPLAGTGSVISGANPLSAGVLQVALSNDAGGKVAADAARVVQMRPPGVAGWIGSEWKGVDSILFFETCCF